ncbi:MAG: DUF349 domain-containing protein [Prevotella sp.]|nr:DUF349 domain-containing protein [Prevotella sp.]MDD7045712.1 DUF349 domain-containing protein [Prevotella sp.]MDY5547379.1 DUF349 domain-containing protein [Prevotella sp.]
MMDSQEKALQQGANAEEKAVDTAVQAAQAAQDETARKVYKTKKEVLDRVREIAQSEENPRKDEIDYLKTVFYKLHFNEREAQQKAYLEQGGDPDKYVVTPDEDEEAFKAEMSIVKEKRAKIFQQQEQEKQANLEKKLDIIEKIKNMATSPDEANQSYNEFKQLQQEWKETGAVPAERASELWRNYQLYVEQFYDLLKLNSEAREYDFKKNLELKTKLCEAAEKLADQEDIISAFHQLQELHQQYREVGPVAKELREDIWNRFKAASTVINKRHQQHFEELRGKEEENLARKTALCEKAEAVAAQPNANSSDWEKRTKEIIDIQAEWKTIGFAPQKMNVKIFERFRAACDDFFGRKGEYFKQLKEKFADNAARKQALVEKAQALQDSTDWKSTSDKLVALQKEWKTIGMVPKKMGEQLWTDFQAACNKFFDARNAANAGTRGEEKANLAKKQEVIEKLKAITAETEGNVQEMVQKLHEEYNKIGHVPFKEKDKVYEEYHAQLDRIYKELNVSIARRKLDNFKSNIKNMAQKGADALEGERSRLVRRFEGLKQDVQTYENNLGFLNASSKKGNSLIDEMNRKVQKLKDEMELVKQKIKAIDQQDAQ